MCVYAYVNGNPISESDPLGLYGGWIAPGGMQSAPLPPAPDFVQFSVDLYVANFSGTFSRSGNSFAGWGVTRQYPNHAGIGASITAGWLLTNSSSCPNVRPTGQQVDNFVNGLTESATAFDGIGGGFLYSPGSNGTALVLGIGAGYGVGPGSVSYLQGATGLGW